MLKNINTELAHLEAEIVLARRDHDVQTLDRLGWRTSGINNMLSAFSWDLKEEKAQVSPQFREQLREAQTRAHTATMAIIEALSMASRHHREDVPF